MTPPAPAIRASDPEREQHADLLREHAAQGRLTVEELSERLELVYGAQTRGELSRLVEDLPALAPPARQRRRRIALPSELVPFVLVNLVLIAVWAATGAGYFWPVWPLLGWGLGLLGPHRRRACGVPRRHLR